MNFLKQIVNYDLYSKNINLRIGANSMTSTAYSKLMTKIVFISIVIYFIQNMIETFQRINLNCNAITKKTYPRPNITLNSDTFKFAFAITDSDGYIITQPELEQYGFPYLYWYSANIENGDFANITRNYSNIRICTSQDFDNFININEEYIESNNLTNYFCPNNSDFQIHGYFDEKKINSVVFKFSYCDSANYNNCKSKEEVMNRLEGGYINFYISEKDIDINNYENPFIKSFKFFSFQILDINKCISEKKYLKSLELDTDKSFFTNDFQNDFSFELVSESIIEQCNSPSTIYLLNVLSYDKADIVTRKYPKIWDGHSSLGGIMKVLIAFGFLITRNFNETEESINLIKSRNLISYTNFDESKIQINNNNLNLLNDKKKRLSNTSFEILMHSSRSKDSSLNPLYNDKNDMEIMNNSINIIKNEKIEIEMEEKIKIPKDLESLMTFKKKKRKSFEEEEENNQKIILKEEVLITNKQDIIVVKENLNKNVINILKENLKEKYEKIKQIQNEFHFSFLEKFLLGFAFQPTEEKKRKLYFDAKNELNKFLDIDYIIGKIKEIEILKQLLFNEQQIKIFNFINKFNYKLTLTKHYSGRWDEQIELAEMIKYFEREENIKGKINEIDRKLEFFVGQIAQNQI